MWAWRARACLRGYVTLDWRLQESSSLKPSGRENIEGNDALLNEQWAVSMQSSMDALMADQTSEQLVEDRAAVRTFSQSKHLSQLSRA